MSWLTIILAILLIASVATIFIMRANNEADAQNIPTDVLQGTSSATQLVNSTTLTKSTNSIGVTISPVSATALKVQFPASIISGYYQVVVYFFSGTASFGNQNWATPSIFLNCQYYLPGTALPGGGVLVQNAPFSPAATSNSGMMQLVYVAVTGTSASFQVNVNSPLTATTRWFVYVTKANKQVANILT